MSACWTLSTSDGIIVLGRLHPAASDRPLRDVEHIHVVLVGQLRKTPQAANDGGAVAGRAVVLANRAGQRDRVGKPSR